jgi:hypothetical protein
LKQRLVAAVREADLDHLPALDGNSQRSDADNGREI